MLLIHLLSSSVSVECISCDSFLPCVYSEIMFTIISFVQKLINGSWNKSGGGGLENFSKISKRGGGGRLFGTREYVPDSNGRCRAKRQS